MVGRNEVADGLEGLAERVVEGVLAGHGARDGTGVRHCCAGRHVVGSDEGNSTKKDTIDGRRLQRRMRDNKTNTKLMITKYVHLYTSGACRQILSPTVRVASHRGIFGPGSLISASSTASTGRLPLPERRLPRSGIGPRAGSCWVLLVLAGSLQACRTGRRPPRVRPRPGWPDRGRQLGILGSATLSAGPQGLC